MVSMIMLGMSIYLVGTATFNIADKVSECNEHWTKQYNELQQDCYMEVDYISGIKLNLSGVKIE